MKRRRSSGGRLAIELQVAINGIRPSETASIILSAVRSRSKPGSNAAHHATYQKLYAEDRRLHDYFGRGENDVMKRLREIRRKV